jgi:probable HAF family extracellular repeat protein
VITLLASLAIASTAFQVPIIIQPLNGYTESHALGINASRHVVGYCRDNSGNTQAFFYDGAIRALNGSNTIAYAINDDDEIIGKQDVSGTTRAAMWADESANISLRGSDASEGYGINASGTACGFYWQNATLYTSLHGELFTLAGAQANSEFSANFADFIQGINASGTTAGWVDNTTTSQHEAWDSGGKLADEARAYAINDSGFVVGEHSNGTNMHAWIWHSSYHTDLGALSSGNSVAYAINAGGDVVGVSNGTLGFVYYDADGNSMGPMVNLQNSVTSGNGTIIDARGINVYQEVCGTILTWSDQTDSDSIPRAYILLLP